MDITAGHDKRWRLVWKIVALGFLLGATLPASAQNLPPRIFNQDPILDEFGKVLQGNGSWPSNLCDRVEILRATNGVIHPPDYEGNPAVGNVLLPNGVSHIGDNVVPEVEGLFCAIVWEPPRAGWTLFVRVFNDPSRTGASFYADSAPFIMQADSENPTQVYEVHIGAMQPLDTRDFDGDDLINSLEKSIGSDPNDPDTDKDWMRDGEEYRAGTDPTNPQSVFVMAWVTTGSGNDAVVGWESVSGKRYQVQYTTDQLSQDPEYQDVGNVVTATGPLSQIIVPDGLLIPRVVYRVRLVEE